MNVKNIILSRQLSQRFIKFGGTRAHKLLKSNQWTLTFLEFQEYDSTNIYQKKIIATITFIISWVLGIMIFLLGFSLFILIGYLFPTIPFSLNIPFFLTMIFMLMGLIANCKMTYLQQHKNENDLNKLTYATTICDIDIIFSTIFAYLLVFVWR